MADTMKVAVLGAGVIGVSTAYYLAERGHSVTIFDRAASVASATSQANGAQLSYSYTDAMARPEFVPKIPGLMLGKDPAVRVKNLGNLALIPWGLKFLGQCTSQKARENTLAVLGIAQRSAMLMHVLQETLELEFSHKRPGKLVLLHGEAALASARQATELKRDHGCDIQVLGPAEAIEREPALAFMDPGFAGAVYSPGDEVGDPLAFSRELAKWLVINRGVDLRLEERVSELVCKGGRVRGVRTPVGESEFDATVVCMGPWSGQLLNPLGINPNICPVRGYSVTLPPGEQAPQASITSIRHRMVFGRVNGAVRIAGFADFLGFNDKQDAGRIATLLDIARRIAPGAADYSVPDKQPWGGFRAMTPSGRPLVGASRYPGLFLNVGHGTLGWTLACGTGHDVAEAVSNS